MAKISRPKVALVTGAGGSIGTATCQQLLDEGYRVFGADLRAQAPSTLPGAVSYHCCDMTDEHAVNLLVDRIEADAGNPVSALVNVAGVVSAGSALDLSVKEMERVMRINVFGSFIPCQVVGRRMAKNRYGAIVNLGSVVGKNSGNARAWVDTKELDRAGNVAYGMSKAAVHTMTGFLAKELAPRNVRVNAVAPGPIATDMTTSFPETLRNLIPLGRMGQADEVAHAISFLLSDKSRFITGETLDINGALWCD
ncbi:SDR family NAD(P)-dependent oxidoreductase [Marinobacter sp.]|uniref:SDR family NAD(P)-dependent oxidoreductase n=1 Tax=Marinobacter sp. TaxID=50741 RepID=UPI0034A386A6